MVIEKSLVIEEDVMVEIKIGEHRVGTCWDNRDGTFTFKLNPRFWKAPFEISEELSYSRSYENYTILVKKD